ncbi:MAG: DUF2298 domain-containing protein [Dehalococcoidia bacterium]
MVDLLAWYVALLAVGMASLLPTSLVFERLRSGGVLYARPIGLVWLGVGCWVISDLTPIPYGLGLILFLLAALVGWSVWLAVRTPARLDAVMSRTPLLLVGEALFLGLFLLIALVRAQAPAAYATEKPMDLMLLTSVRASDSLPATDAWFSGAPLSYYHLGHVMVDIVGRLTGAGPGIEFNLGLAMAGAIAGAAVFALAGDAFVLTRPRRPASVWIAGALAVAGLLFLSTEIGFIDLLGANGVGRGLWPHLGVGGVPPPQSTQDGVPTQFWWWWHATRILPGTITEFPTFSIVLGDLHAHVLALPLAVVAVAVALPTFEGMSQLSWRAWTRRPGALLLVGMLFAALVMTNAWDTLIYGLLWGAATVIAFLGAGWRPVPALLLAARYLALPAGLALLLAGPFLRGLETPSLGVGLLTAEWSDPARFLLVWLPLLVPLLAAAVMLRPRLPRGTALAAFAVAGGSIAAWMVATIVADEQTAIADRGIGWFVLIGLGLALSWLAASTWGAYRDGDRGQSVWLALATFAAAVVLVLELVYLEDELGGRLNGIFKFWYAAWLLLAVAGAVGLASVYDRVPKLEPWRYSVPLSVALILLSAGALLYGPAATVARSREGQHRGLDGLAYLSSDPGLVAAINWAQANLDHHDVLLEAVGADYQGGNIVSAATGIPTLIGWPGHQIQWRGKIPAIAERENVVARVYQEGATEDVRALARRYGVTHVYIGSEERTQFGVSVAARFDAWPAVFDAPGVRIVAVPEAGANP